MPARVAAYRCLAGLAAIGLLALTGCSNPWTNGRYWRQPVEGKSGPPPMAIRVGRGGGVSSESGIGPGFSVSDSWRETAGVGVGRRGTSADSGSYRERSMNTGDVHDGARFGRYSEGSISTGSAGGSAKFGSYRETSMRAGVGG